MDNITAIANYPMLFASQNGTVASRHQDEKSVSSWRNISLPQLHSEQNVTVTTYVDNSSTGHAGETSAYRTGLLLVPAGYYSIGTTLSVLALVGLLQNLLVLAALRKRRQEGLAAASNQHHQPVPVAQNPAKSTAARFELLIQVLLSTDVVMCALSIPFSAVSSFAKRWLFGDGVCAWYGFSMTFLGFSNIFLLTIISVERMTTMQQIIMATSVTKMRHLVTTIVISFSVALGLSLPPFFGVSSFHREGIGISCAIDWLDRSPASVAYNVGLIVLGFTVPLGVIIGSYTSIYFKVSRMPWSQTQAMQRRVRMEIHLAKTIFYTAGAFLFTWSPYVVVTIATLVVGGDAIPPIFHTLPAIFAKSSILCNGIVYIYMNKDLRKLLLKHFFPCCVFTQSTNAVQPAMATNALPLQPANQSGSVQHSHNGPSGNAQHFRTEDERVSVVGNADRVRRLYFWNSDGESTDDADYIPSQLQGLGLNDQHDSGANYPVHATPRGRKLPLTPREPCYGSGQTLSKWATTNNISVTKKIHLRQMTKPGNGNTTDKAEASKSNRPCKIENSNNEQTPEITSTQKDTNLHKVGNPSKEQPTETEAASMIYHNVVAPWEGQALPSIESGQEEFHRNESLS